VGDARSLELPDRSVGACLSNLPFGQQYSIQGDMHTWLRSVLGEMARVTRLGGRVVLLVTTVPSAKRTLSPTSMRDLPTLIVGCRARLAAGRRARVEPASGPGQAHGGQPRPRDREPGPRREAGSYELVGLVVRIRVGWGCSVGMTAGVGN